MSAEKHGLTAEDVERLQEIVETRQNKLTAEDYSNAPYSTQEQQEEAFDELERLCEEVGLTWVTANRVERGVGLSINQVTSALKDLCEMGLAERMGSSPYKYRLHPLESR